MWDLAVHAGQLKEPHGRFYQLLSHWLCAPMQFVPAAPITNRAEYWRRGPNQGDTSDRPAGGPRRNHSRNSGNERLYWQHASGGRA